MINLIVFTTTIPHCIYDNYSSLYLRQLFLIVFTTTIPHCIYDNYSSLYLRQLFLIVFTTTIPMILIVICSSISVFLRVTLGRSDLFLLTHDEVIDLWDVNDKVCDCPTDTKEEDIFQCSPNSAVTCLRDKTTDQVGVKTCHAIPPGRKRRSTQFPWKGLQRHRRRRAVSTTMILLID
jgi:hypothetical protein